MKCCCLLTKKNTKGIICVPILLSPVEVVLFFVKLQLFQNSTFLRYTESTLGEFCSLLT